MSIVHCTNKDKDNFKLNHEPKLDAREASDKDVPIWNFQNGQSTKEWGVAHHTGYSRYLTGVGLINHCLVINHNIFYNLRAPI